jgi:hypothetical protein
LGESGKAPGAFDAVATWDPVAGDEGKPAVTVAQKGNPKLGPERTRELELGFDLGALDNRISLELTAFRARTYGALIGVTYPPSEGFSQSQLENVGTLENKGIEAQLTAGIFRSEAIDWQTRVSYTGLKSKAIDLGEVAGEPRQVPTGNGSWVRRGYAVPTLFGAVIKNPDEFANPVVVLDSAIGPVYPTRIVSVGTTLSLRNRLTFDVLGEHQGGSHLGNWIGYQNALRNVWRPCYAVQKKLRQALGPDGVANTADDVPAAIADVTARDRGRCAIDRTVQNSDFWISPIDYFKLRSVSVTYQLPQRLFAGGRSATLTIAGRNLFKSTKYDGADPESYDAQDAGNNIGRREYYQLPPYKTVIVTLRTIF